MNAGDENQTQKYSYLIQAKKETAEKVMPRVPKKQRRALCYDARVEKGRNHLKEVRKRHVRENTKYTHLEFEQCKEKLDEAYSLANEEYLERKLNEFEKANVNQKYQTAWSLINEVSGRKKSRAGRLQGNTNEERIHLVVGIATSRISSEILLRY